MRSAWLSWPAHVQWMQSFFLRYLELLLTAAGLAVIIAASTFIHPEGVSRWMVTAITAIVVGVIHGLLFWAVRHRQRLVRRHALAETQHMLRDIVNNQLAIIRMDLDLANQPAGGATARSLDHMQRAIDTISQTLDNVNEESLARWQSHYGSSASSFLN